MVRLQKLLSAEDRGTIGVAQARDPTRTNFPQIMKPLSGSDGGGTPCMINENNFDRDLRLELSRARYDICDNIMSSRPIFVERGGQESLSFLTGFGRIRQDSGGFKGV